MHCAQGTCQGFCLGHHGLVRRCHTTTTNTTNTTSSPGGPTSICQVGGPIIRNTIHRRSRRHCRRLFAYWRVAAAVGEIYWPPWKRPHLFKAVPPHVPICAARVRNGKPAHVDGIHCPWRVAPRHLNHVPARDPHRVKERARAKQPDRIVGAPDAPDCPFAAPGRQWPTVDICCATRRTPLARHRVDAIAGRTLHQKFCALDLRI